MIKKTLRSDNLRPITARGAQDTADVILAALAAVYAERPVSELRASSGPAAA